MSGEAALPALVEGRLVKGRVVLAAAGVHTSSSDWPLAPAFVLLVRELAWYLSDSSPQAIAASGRTSAEGLAAQIPPEMAAGACGAFRMKISGTALDYQPVPFLRPRQRMARDSSIRPPHSA